MLFRARSEIGLDVEKVGFITAKYYLITSNYLFQNRDKNSLYSAWRIKYSKSVKEQHTIQFIGREI